VVSAAKGRFQPSGSHRGDQFAEVTITPRSKEPVCWRRKCQISGVMLTRSLDQIRSI